MSIMVWKKGGEKYQLGDVFDLTLNSRAKIQRNVQQTVRRVIIEIVERKRLRTEIHS